MNIYLPQSLLCCRSSSNSLGRRRYGFGGAPLVGGSLRVHSTRSPNSYIYAAEQESLLSHPAHSHHPLPPNHPPRPLFLSRHFAARRDRRALSLELPELLRAGLPAVHPEPGKRTGSGTAGSIYGGSAAGSGLGADHRDCNGKTPGPHTQLMTEVFPQVNARKERTDLDEETDYVSGSSFIQQHRSIESSLFGWSFNITQPFLSSPFCLSPVFQSLCFRIQKMIEVYKPDWCESREEWSVYLFSPQNKWADDFRSSP